MCHHLYNNANYKEYVYIKSVNQIPALCHHILFVCTAIVLYSIVIQLYVHGTPYSRLLSPGANHTHVCLLKYVQYCT